MSNDLTPIIQFTMPDSDLWHPNTTFGVSADGRILILLETGWATSAYHLPDSIQHLCLQVLCKLVTA